MGRIKTKLIKRISREILEKYKDQISTDFKETNHKLLSFAEVRSKKLKNIIAGYLVRLRKNMKDYEL
ncbi:30S ribosomal protein S17e [Candidatus Woesearchaeota archaeon]|jgi:small subunit ribosomal protein S17e|nr:30S ribosomal protein S17e [Candidatus Woesearchaeota archaeon]MBT4387898.1 30S ribosomal protein S17e [Candidatus Woesearchaeota archaeon]MBT4595716.1 30S ribosomal protein S17e [Candidatus Woesearchaeota archaeon]MBT5741435.1 30S ribosomal protein S17e [Candidatus Woesearchaeota archaeon]MBT6505541.1 30S ribosomal protein S17e [Candidatus Woesearchaeota archaeon]